MVAGLIPCGTARGFYHCSSAVPHDSLRTRISRVLFCNTDSMSATAPNYNHCHRLLRGDTPLQAVINNFMPLLFVTFAATLGIDIGAAFRPHHRQLRHRNWSWTCWPASSWTRRIQAVHYRRPPRPPLPDCWRWGAPTRVPDPYLAILAAIFLYALGGGLIEVMVSPSSRGLPSEPRPRRDEPVALLLLLGVARHSGHLHAVSFCVRHRLMAGSRFAYWRLCACHRHPRCSLALPCRALCRKANGDHAVRRLVEEAGVHLMFLMMLLLQRARAEQDEPVELPRSPSPVGVTKVIGDLAGPAHLP